MEAQTAGPSPGVLTGCSNKGREPWWVMQQDEKVPQVRSSSWEGR